MRAEQRSQGMTPHWMIYFYVSNCDETAEKTKELGGKALLAPMAIEKVGRMVILADPQGAVFALYQSTLR